MLLNRAAYEAASKLFCAFIIPQIHQAIQIRIRIFLSLFQLNNIFENDEINMNCSSWIPDIKPITGITNQLQ